MCINSRGEMVGSSNPAMQAVLQKVELAALSHCGVLITGESGTGKELVAEAIYAKSPRAQSPFIAVNCGAVPEGIADSEFFGHDRGAFTNAVKDHPGLFEQANGGTLLLDEIAELPWFLQVKLLRVAEGQPARRVGGERFIKTDVRIIAATNQDLKKLVATGKFRADLFYRLNVVHIHLPPLRERTEDIPDLVAFFIRELNVRDGCTIDGVSDELMSALMAYAWPGNIRELASMVQSMGVMRRDGTLLLQDFPQGKYQQIVTQARSGVWSSDAIATMLMRGGFQMRVEKARTIAAFEQVCIDTAVKITNGNLAKAARLLGLGRKTLYRFMHRIGTEPPRRSKRPKK